MTHANKQQQQQIASVMHRLEADIDFSAQPVFWCSIKGLLMLYSEYQFSTINTALHRIFRKYHIQKKYTARKGTAPYPGSSWFYHLPPFQPHMMQRIWQLKRQINKKN